MSRMRVRIIGVCLCLAVLVGATLPVSATAGAPTEQPAARSTHDPDTVADLQATSPPANGTKNWSVTVSNVSFVGPNVVARSPNSTFVWESSGYNVSVDLNVTGAEEKHYVNVCFEQRNAPSENNSTSSEPTCNVLETQKSGKSGFRVRYDNLTRGEQILEVTVPDPQSNVTMDRRNVSVTVIRPMDDFDGDLLNNQREVNYGTKLYVADTDGDGLDDGAEVDNYGTDPLASDTDEDGLPDAQEVQIATNATVADTDGDGLDDGTEWNNQRTSPTKADTDGDGLDDRAEVRVYHTDPSDPDTDGDGWSDNTEVQLGTNPNNPLMPLLVVLGVVALLFVVALGVAWRYRDRIHEAGVERSDTFARLDERVGGADGDSGDGEANATQLAGDGATFDLTVETDEDRVVNLLYQHGGRIRQRELVEQTEWSDSKVSRLLSGMEEDGLLRKVRLGRENVVVLETESGDDDADGEAAT